MSLVARLLNGWAATPATEVTMTYADRLHRWNRWYDRTPEQWRFHLVVWALVVVGALNMLLTISIGFPFGLLLVVAIAAIAAVRVPHALGWVWTQEAAEAAGGAGARMEIAAPSWVIAINRWYDDLPEHIRPFVLLAALAIPGALNMVLTIAGGFPFGVLFLLAVLAVIAIRAPYAAGWIQVDQAGTRPALSVMPPASRLGTETTGATLAGPAPSVEDARFPVEARSAEAAPPPGGAPAESPPLRQQH
jgi:hypothetical protein